VWLGGPVAADLAWAPDSRHLLFDLTINETSSLRLLDIEGGSLVDARKVALDHDLVLPAAFAYRTFDGLVGVLCCPDPGGGDPGGGVPGDVFAVFDPSTGAAKGRLALPFAARDFVYDRSGRHQLFVTADGTVQRRSGGPFTAIAGISGVALVAW